MRVLHFYKTSFPDTVGGIEQVINQLARGMSKLGIETDVLSLTPERVSSTLEIDGYLAHRVPLDFHIASTGFSYSAYSRFKALARQADLIHYHFPWPFMDVMHFAAKVEKPSLVTYHSDIIRQKHLLKLYRPLMNRFLASVDQIVASSPNYLSTSAVLKKLSHKVQVIPYGLDKATYPQSMPEGLRYWREKLGPKFFLFVGVLRYYKGLSVLLEAAQGTGYPIVIVGSGPIERELKVQSAQLGLQNIYFLGPLSESDKSALLTLCHGVVFPSHLRSEAFGISLLEGAMYGKPMVSCEIGTGTSFVNIDNDTGLVVPPSDPVALRQAMRFLWEHPETAAEMGARAEERYYKLFTARHMLTAYQVLYQHLIGA
ncbi:MAG: glycosyltransferase family 4 protein [Methylococcaceae bacterium]